MIKEVHQENIGDIAEPAYGFFSESKLPGVLNFEYWAKRWQEMIEMQVGYIFAYVYEGKPVGIIGGLCVRCTMTAQLEMIEAFWYMMPQHRGGMGGVRLLRALEQRAVTLGASRIKMTHLSDLNADKVRDIYMKMGYEPIQHSYSKELVN